MVGDGFHVEENAEDRVRNRIELTVDGQLVHQARLFNHSMQIRIILLPALRQRAEQALIDVFAVFGDVPVHPSIEGRHGFAVDPYAHLFVLAVIGNWPYFVIHIELFLHILRELIAVVIARRLRLRRANRERNLLIKLRQCARSAQQQHYRQNQRNNFLHTLFSSPVSVFPLNCVNPRPSIASLPGIFRVDYIFTAPTRIPFAKYFWRNGYTNIIGSIVSTTDAILTPMEKFCKSCPAAESLSITPEASMTIARR